MYLAALAALSAAAIVTNTYRRGPPTQRHGPPVLRANIANPLAAIPAVVQDPFVVERFLADAAPDALAVRRPVRRTHRILDEVLRDVQHGFNRRH